MPADVRVAGASADKGWPEPQADTAQEGLARPVDILHGELKDGQVGGSGGSGGAGRAFGGRPFGSASVVLDEERRQTRVEARCRSQPPADDLAIGTAPLTGRRSGQVGSPGAKVADVVVDGVGRDRPRRETAATFQRTERRSADPRGCRALGVEDADQLEIRVAEPDEAVVCTEQVVPPTAPWLQPEPCLQVGRGGVRVRDGDHEMVDTLEHRCSVRARAARGREAGR